ncbi:DUF4192 domain-containing protein [Arthrobacter sp. Soc17.1.1.1]|uniref:DUF4192 domain-containing protein n=1 Tax=Arthrobacter sp. Soc17.1.1.1 TaxID=3121277 RepID=UPI002FE46F29
MNENTHNQLTATTAADLLAFIPSALGFQPRESFAFVTMRGTMTGATLRVDTPAEMISPTDFAHKLMRYLRTDTAADSVLLFVYTNEVAEAAQSGTNPDAKPYMDYARAIETELDRAGISLQNGWLITDKGWTPYFCEDSGCCTLNPTNEIRDSIMNAELIYRGYNTQKDPMTLAVDPAFIGSDQAHLTITEFTYLVNLGGVPEALDFDHTSMRIAREQWSDALGKEFHDALGEESAKENEACDLAGYLFIKPIRDRIMADAISPTDDEATYQQVLAGRFEGQPDWARVEATEELLIRIFAYTPIEDRAPLFCFLGWLRWYRGQSSVAAAYFDKALESDHQHRLARLMREMVSRGILPLAAQNEHTAYRH